MSSGCRVYASAHRPMGTWRVMRSASQSGSAWGDGGGGELVVLPVGVDRAEQHRFGNTMLRFRSPGSTVDSARPPKRRSGRSSGAVLSVVPGDRHPLHRRCTETRSVAPATRRPQARPANSSRARRRVVKTLHLVDGEQHRRLIGKRRVKECCRFLLACRALARDG